MAANIFTGAVNNNWGTAGNWSLGSVPTTSDGHVATFDATSPDCNMNLALAPVFNLDLSAYTNNFSNTAMIPVYGTSVVLGSGFGGTDNITLQLRTTISVTINGNEWLGTITGANSANTVTIDDDWTIKNLLGAAIGFNGNKKIYVKSNCTWHNGIFGNCTIELIGTGNFGGSAQYCTCPVIINTAGTITFVESIGNIGCRAQDLTYIAGTVDSTAVRLTAYNNANYNLDGITINHFYNNCNAGSVFLNSKLTANIITISGTNEQIFAGTHGFECNILIIDSNNYDRANTIKAGLTYKVNSEINFNTNNYPLRKQYLYSSTASSSAFLVLGANCKVIADNVFIRDIDCSGGKTMKTLHSTLTRTTNITNYTTYYFEDELPAVDQVEKLVSYGDVRGTVFTGTLAQGGAMAIMT